MTREVPLSRGLVAIVDDEDYEAVMAVGPWYADRSGPRGSWYGRKNFNRGGTWTAVRLHAFIAGTGADHINGDTLDNRRSNLRPATAVENARNRKTRADNLSGYKGIYPRRDHRCTTPAWHAAIWVDGKRLHLGTYASPAEAARGYDAAALQHFGEFARLNFPQEQAS